MSLTTVLKKYGDITPEIFLTLTLALLTLLTWHPHSAFTCVHPYAIWTWLKQPHSSARPSIHSVQRLGWLSLPPSTNWKSSLLASNV